MSSKLKICLVIPPNDGTLGGSGDFVDAEGRVHRMPLFPKPEGMKLIKTYGATKLRGSVPPLGILYVASQLQAAGMEVMLLDFQTSRFDLGKLEKAVDECDRVGITTITGSYESVRHISQLIRRRKPEMAIIVGGPDATINPDRYRPLATVIFQGESEGRVVPVFQGPWYEYKLAEWPSVQPPFENCPWPARELIDHRDYRFLGGLKAGSMIASRGCPRSCTYCARSGLLCYTYRRRAVKQVLDELEAMYDDGFDFVAFADSNLSGAIGYAEEIWQGIIDRKIKILSSASLSVHHLTPESYKLAREAGCVAMSFGFESGNDHTLRAFCKQATVADNANAIKLAGEADILIKGNFILGHLSEDMEATLRTIEWARTQPIDVAHFGILMYAKGSEMWANAVKHGQIGPEEVSVRVSKERGLSRLTEKQLSDVYKHAVRRNRCHKWDMLGKILRPQNLHLLPVAVKAGWSLLRSSL